MSLEFNVLTSIRSDEVLQSGNQDEDGTVGRSGTYGFYLLDFHRRRLIQACKAFERDWAALEGETGLANCAIHLQAAVSNLIGGGESQKQTRPIKLRLEFTKQQEFKVTASYVATIDNLHGTLYPRNLDDIPELTKATYRIFISPIPSEANLFTKHKTTNRGLYDTQRALLSSPSGLTADTDIISEILLVNEAVGQIMEGSITTPYFRREDGWITPTVSCGGHIGVSRRWAISRSLAKAAIILAKDIQIGEIVILSNGVRGFGWGKIEALDATSVRQLF